MENEIQNNNAHSEPDIETINRAARSAVARALSMKKRLGLSAVAWKDGRITVIPPEQIVVDENLLRQNGTQPYIVD
jgi:hypothetical protein